MTNNVKNGLAISDLRQDMHDFVMNVRKNTTSKWDYIIYGVEVLTFEGSQTFEFLITDGKCEFDDIQYIVSDYILDETDLVLKYVSATVMTLREVPIFKTHKVKDIPGLWKFFQTVQKGITDKIRGTIEGQATVYVKVFTDSEYSRYINTDGVVTLKNGKVMQTLQRAAKSRPVHVEGWLEDMIILQHEAFAHTLTEAVQKDNIIEQDVTKKNYKEWLYALKIMCISLRIGYSTLVERIGLPDEI